LNADASNSENKFLKSLKPETIATPEKIDIAPLLELMATQPSKFYHYSGSLTTPPCTESVDWAVYKEPLQITIAQLTYFQNLFLNNGSFQGNTADSVGSNGGNFRTAQGLNGRTVYMSSKDNMICPYQ
jgi:carbonic anhydrase